jgi:predicted lipid-binding transport protein (Tim44 family)
MTFGEGGEIHAKRAGTVGLRQGMKGRTAKRLERGQMIVMAYADGDRKTLKNLLSKEVYDGFVAAIGEREAKSEKIQSSFVGIDKADIVSAEMKGGEAHVTLRIISELISATRDKAGTVIDGDPETVAEVKDVWTFARDTRSRDPNWKLVATEEED